MSRFVLLTALAATLPPTVGCRAIGGALIDSLLGIDRDEEEEEQDDQFDHLWKSGYGFNNPNAERIRQGKEPEDF